MVRGMYPTVLQKNFISIDVDHFLSFCLCLQVSLLYRRIGITSALCTFILEDFRTKFVLKEFLVFVQILLVFVEFHKIDM